MLAIEASLVVEQHWVVYKISIAKCLYFKTYFIDTWEPMNFPSLWKPWVRKKKKLLTGPGTQPEITKYPLNDIPKNNFNTLSLQNKAFGFNQIH